jgi:hypothetical protein
MWRRIVNVLAGNVIIERMSPRVAKKTDSRLAARLAAIASLGAAVVHFAVVPTHWQVWMPSGLFFASIAMFQLIWALLVPVWRTAAVLAAGIVANVGAAALWALSRTAGAPFGPHAGEPEVVEAAGLCALLLECYVVMGAGWVWYRGRRAEPISGFANAIVFGGASAVIAAAATAGVVSSLLHDDHHAPVGAEHDSHASVSGHETGHHDHPEQIAESIRPPAAPAPVETPPPATDSAHDIDGDHH